MKNKEKIFRSIKDTPRKLIPALEPTIKLKSLPREKLIIRELACGEAIDINKSIKFIITDKTSYGISKGMYPSTFPISTKKELTLTEWDSISFKEFEKLFSDMKNKLIEEENKVFTLLIEGNSIYKGEMLFRVVPKVEIVCPSKGFPECGIPEIKNYIFVIWEDIAMYIEDN